MSPEERDAVGEGGRFRDCLVGHARHEHVRQAAIGEGKRYQGAWIARDV